VELELELLQQKQSREDEHKGYYARQLLNTLFGKISKMTETEDGIYYVFALKEVTTNYGTNYILLVSHSNTLNQSALSQSELSQSESSQGALNQTTTLSWSISATTKVIESSKANWNKTECNGCNIYGNWNGGGIMEFNKDGYACVKGHKCASVNCKLVAEQVEANSIMELEEKIIDLETETKEAELESLGNISMKAVSGIALDDNCEEGGVLEIIGLGVFHKKLLY
jgi:hypothetical protein